MKKFLSNISFFSLFFITAYVSVVYLYGRLMPADLRPNIYYNKEMFGTTNNMLSDLSRQQHVDILIVGASDAYRSYDTRIFTDNGYSVFNAGSSSQTPMQTYLLLKENIERLSPRLVLYEVSPVCFELDGVESTTDLMLNGYSHKSIFPVILRNPDIHLVNSFLFDFTDRHIVKRSVKKFSSNKEKYILNGFVEMNLFYNTERPVGGRSWEPKQSQLNYFNKILGLLKERDSNYLLLNAPSITDKGFFNRHSFDSLFMNSAEFLNGLDQQGFDPEKDFFDPSHLNQSGVKKWDAIVLEKVKKILLASK